MSLPERYREPLRDPNLCKIEELLPLAIGAGGATGNADR